MLRLLLFTLLASNALLAQSRIDCSQIESKILHSPVHYCVMLPPSYDAAQQYPVLYYLHGLGDNEQTLFKSGGWNLLQELRQQHRIGDFLVVAPEGKASFFINSSDGKTLYGDFLMREFIPGMEKKYRLRKDRGSRGISGVSMGGYGALRLAFAHPELFGSVSAQSAALAAGSAKPGDSFARFLAPVFGNPVDIPHWKQNDPRALARQNQLRLKAMAIYFNCGRNDEYGFENGAEALHQQLQSESIRHEYHLYPGNHGAEYFLRHLDEVMEFHSRVFASGR